QALNTWAGATRGRINFVRSTRAPIDQIINIGVGDLKAVGGARGPGQTLSLGGATPSASGPHTLSNGVAWLNSAFHWDSVLGNGDQPGTFDFLTAAAHEVGLALGLSESSDRTSTDVMGNKYLAELASFSAGDLADIQAVYPFAPPSGKPGAYDVLL